MLAALETNMGPPSGPTSLGNLYQSNDFWVKFRPQNGGLVGVSPPKPTCLVGPLVNCNSIHRDDLCKPAPDITGGLAPMALAGFRKWMSLKSLVENATCLMILALSINCCHCDVETGT